MDKELLLIDLLANKQHIQTIFKTFFKKRISHIILLALATSLFFFGCGFLFFNLLSSQTDNFFYLTRLADLYLFSKIIGWLFLSFFATIACFHLGHYVSFNRHFQDWLENQINLLSDWELIEEDTNYYYFIDQQEIKEVPTKRSLLKKSIVSLNTSEDDYHVLIGRSQSLFGLYRIYMLIDTQKELPQATTKKHHWQKKLTYSFVALFASGLLLSYFYLVGPLNKRDIIAADLLTNTETTSNETFDSALKGGTSTAIKESSELQMTYHMDQANDALYQTTDHGQSWQHVPISISSTRQGEYTLSSGGIPEGYFMNQTFDISPDFSWYLYSPTEAADARLPLAVLISEDNGQTWQSHDIADSYERLRYRKMQTNKNGSFFVITSIADIMSSESIFIYDSNDYGKTWHKTGETSLDTPLQHASFISQQVGFLATRDSLYYTNDYAQHFEKSLIQLPQGYTTEGLDIFTSPNEVTQKSANLLSIRLNLVKTQGSDKGALIECEFLSQDQGATWSFEQELQPIITSQ